MFAGDEKRRALVVTVVLMEDDRVYAQRLQTALEKMLKRDKREGIVRVSVVRMPL